MEKRLWGDEKREREKERIIISDKLRVMVLERALTMNASVGHVLEYMNKSK